ncbi:MAG TPA: hypothetical protein VFJ95_13425, partial [Gammaproteobacteria bacterium]|nr:hypothetical protein [Gammaproteobacteria bacterium]
MKLRTSALCIAALLGAAAPGVSLAQSPTPRQAPATPQTPATRQAPAQAPAAPPAPAARQAPAQRPALSAAELPAERRVPAEQTTALSKNPKWKAPRTSWGHPSLAGTYSTDDMRGIPRDRPEALGTVEFLSEEQFLARATEQYT